MSSHVKFFRGITYLEHEPDSRERDAEVESHKDEVKLVSNLTQPDGRHLTPHSSHKPVTKSSCESRTASTDTQRENLTGVYPRNWTERH